MTPKNSNSKSVSNMTAGTSAHSTSTNINGVSMRVLAAPSFRPTPQPSLSLSSFDVRRLMQRHRRGPTNERALILIDAQLQTEIKIHRTLQHPRVVRFEMFFEDRENVYILLELCTNHVRRRNRLERAGGIRPHGSCISLPLLTTV